MTMIAGELQEHAPAHQGSAKRCWATWPRIMLITPEHQDQPRRRAMMTPGQSLREIPVIDPSVWLSGPI